MLPLRDEPPTVEALLPGERTWLVRLCASLSGEPAAAEDLAQDALLEAWRHLHTFRDHHDRVALRRWLHAIARNVCLRWARTSGRTTARQISLTHEDEQSGLDLADSVADNWKLEVELERDELAQLLDQALALLPAPTRDVLIQAYIHEAPHAEIAARLGVSSDAVAQRLRRGRLALRRMFSTTLSEDAEACGLSVQVSPAFDTTSVSPPSWNDILAVPAAWNETRIWCPLCGASRLVYWLDRDHNIARFGCPGCRRHIAGTDVPSVLQDVHSPRAILKRQIAWLTQYFRQALSMRACSCPQCGQRAIVHPNFPADTPESMFEGLSADLRSRLGVRVGLQMTCAHCGLIDGNPLTHLAIDVPETQRFWRTHPRMRSLPEYEVETQGRPAIVSTFESVNDSARLIIITARDDLSILNIHGAPSDHRAGEERMA